METLEAGHPVRLVVTDDLRRSRLTVFLRLLLAIPHLFWIALWATVVFVIVVISWFATLIKGQSPAGLHGFLAEYLRYATHVEAYLLLAANPYPAFFVGSASPYPIDLEIDPPAPQNRLKTGFRALLAIPALVIATVFTGGVAVSGTRVGGVALTAAVLLWFVALVRGRAPRGLHDLTSWCIGYGAQAAAYLMLLTDRYPYTGPERHLAGLEPPVVDERVPGLVNADDPRRSRLTVLLRLPLAVPHLVWWLGWFVLVALAWIPHWLFTLAMGRPARPLARFSAAWVRYSTHVFAFLSLVGGPFPGFTGKPGSYPVDPHIDPFHRQKRWITLGRPPVPYVGPPLAWPALLLSSALQGLLVVVAMLGWFVALVRGRMPAGLQRAGAYCLGYSAQFWSYALFLTDRYPHASPQAVFLPRVDRAAEIGRTAGNEPLDS